MTDTKVPIELSSTPGIIDNSTATAITIDSAGAATFSGDVRVGENLDLAELSVRNAGTPSKRQLYIGSSANGTSLEITAAGALNVGGAATFSSTVRSTGYSLTAATGQYYHFDATTGNNFMGLHGTNTLGFYAGGVLALTLGPTAGAATFSGQVAAGPSSYGGSPNASTSLLLTNSGHNYLTIGAGSTSEGAILFADAADNDVGAIGYSHSTNAMTFVTNAAARMTLDASGSINLGVTTPTHQTDSLVIYQPDHYALYSGSNGTGGSNHMVFGNASGWVGSIATNGSATIYSTSSDYRLKEDDVPMTGATERVKALRPINFAWKVDGSRTDGFFAHEAQEVVPEAVHGSKDAMRDEEYEVTPAVEEVRDEEGNVTTEAVAAVMGTRSVPDYQGIDQSKLVPLLTATIQELIARIEALEGA